MTKHIDANRLKAEIERRIDDFRKRRFDVYANEFASLLDFLDSLQQEQPIKVYRVENEKEQKGLWRKFDGTWEPLFDMLTDGQCKDMPMEDSPIYREGGKQWFASAPSKETLQKWFSKRDLEELTAKGFTISEFEVVGHKKISDFEYIFTRDNIISRTYLKVSDIYPQDHPDFPTTDEEVEKVLSTIPKAELPDKYKTPDWLFEKQEQQKLDSRSIPVLRADTTEKQDRILEIIGQDEIYCHFPLDFGKETDCGYEDYNDRVYIDGVLTFNKMAEIVDFLSKNSK